MRFFRDFKGKDGKMESDKKDENLDVNLKNLSKIKYSYCNFYIL